VSTHIFEWGGDRQDWGKAREPKETRIGVEAGRGKTRLRVSTRGWRYSALRKNYQERGIHIRKKAWGNKNGQRGSGLGGTVKGQIRRPEEGEKKGVS